MLGLFRELLGLDGGYGLVWAAPSRWPKLVLIPLSKRLKPPEDSTRDDVQSASEE
jgi:hypothetical protein